MLLPVLDRRFLPAVDDAALTLVNSEPAQLILLLPYAQYRPS